MGMSAPPIADIPRLYDRIDSPVSEEHPRHGSKAWAGTMRHYRINKLSKPGGIVVKKIDVLASSDGDAVQRAAESDDCPVCDVLKDGRRVGSIT
jgi:hypothetical protein